MASYRRRGGAYPPPQPQSRQDDHFYDDRRSRSRSPDRRNTSPPRQRSPPYDYSRAPRGPAGRRSPKWRDSSRDNDDYYSRRRSPSPRRGRSYYDRDRPHDDTYERRTHERDSKTPERGERSTSRGRPSKEIMLDGLAPHLTENDISAELKQHYRVNRLDDVRVIRDRQTKQSRQFGFLRFPTLEEAEDFMDQNYPNIYLYGDSGDGHHDSSKVRLSYGKERRDRGGDETDWICPNCNINNYATRSRCFRCQTPRAEAMPAAKPANTGDNDASPDNTPSQFLLIRGLEGSVTEELFAKGVGKLNKPSGSTAQPAAAASKKGAKVASTTGDANLGAREGTLRRVLLVRDRRTNESWRYGFAEYASIEDAQAAVVRYNSFDRFTIASKHVLVSYIHAGVFVPVLNPTPSTERFLFSPANNSATKLAYWDEEGYVTELVVSAREPSKSDAGDAEVARLAQSEGLKSTPKDSEKVKKRKAAADVSNTTTKKPASHLQFWSNRHAELHGIKPGSLNGSSGPTSENGDPYSPPAVAPSQSFADPVRHCCYLCMRQFDDSAEVNTHERVSELHRANLKNKAKVTKALGKLEKHNIAIQPTSSSDAVTGEYRDRAKERRRIHGVVNKKGENVVSNKTRTATTATASDSDDDDDSSSKPPAAKSKGASLLSKMGYTPGAGLGAKGNEGRTAPIAQDVYAPGVGLGAEGGKRGDAVEEAQRNTKGDGFGEWVAQGKDRARERYERMNMS